MRNDERQHPADQIVDTLSDQQREASEYAGAESRQQEAADAAEVAEYGEELSQHTATHPSVRRAEARLYDIMADTAVDESIESDESKMSAFFGPDAKDDDDEIVG